MIDEHLFQRRADRINNPILTNTYAYKPPSALHFDVSGWERTPSRDCMVSKIRGIALRSMCRISRFAEGITVTS